MYNGKVIKIITNERRKSGRERTNYGKREEQVEEQTEVMVK